MQLFEPEPPRGLRDLQARFSQALLLRAAGQADGTTAIDCDLSRKVPLDPATGLSAHAAGYPVRIHDALLEAFPAVAHLVGDAEFAAISARYTAASPPNGYNLNEAGARFADYLEMDPTSHPYGFLPDLARLEWRIVRAFHAPRRQSADPSRLARLAEVGDEACEGGIVELQPGTAVVRSQWPILDLWQLRETPRPEIPLPVAGCPERVLVWREGETVKLDLVDVHESDVIARLVEGATLAHLLEQLAAQSIPDEAVMRSFARCVRLGLLAEPADR